MERRDFIQIVAGGVIPTTGCLGSFQDQSDQTETTVNQFDQNRTTEGQPNQNRTTEGQPNQTETTDNTQVMGVSINQLADETEVNIEARFVNRFTDEKPARIQIRFTNEAESEQQFRFGSSPPLSTYVSDRDETNKLVLIPDDMSHISVGDRNGDDDFQLIPEESRDSCWRVEDQIIGEDILISRTLESGKSVAETYTVLAGPKNDPCIPAGQYRFEDDFGVNKNWFKWELIISIPSK